LLTWRLESLCCFADSKQGVVWAIGVLMLWAIVICESLLVASWNAWRESSRDWRRVQAVHLSTLVMFI
jgi:hypothetical protein